MPRGERNSNKTHCPYGHEYIPENIRWNKRGNGWGRDCKACLRTDEARARARAAAKRWKKKYPERAKQSSRNTKLKQNFGIALDQYNILFEAQNGVCAICNKPETSPSAHNPNVVRSLAVDHNHCTGKVRGLLCVKCNKAIALFYENLALLDKAKDYLLRHSKSEIGYSPTI